MRNKCVVRHEDMDVLRIVISDKTNGANIFKMLNGVVEETGIPKQVISDHGSDIKKGVISDNYSSGLATIKNRVFYNIMQYRY